LDTVLRYLLVSFEVAVEAGNSECSSELTGRASNVAVSVQHGKLKSDRGNSMCVLVEGLPSVYPDIRSFSFVVTALLSCVVVTRRPCTVLCASPRSSGLQQQILIVVLGNTWKQQHDQSISELLHCNAGKKQQICDRRLKAEILLKLA
jgi:hypothetical protein